MTKTNWKYLVDVLMFLTMVGVILIGLLLAFFLEEGPALNESDKFFLGLHRHQWGDIHSILSLSFAVFLIFHLCLEWNWIKGKSKMIFKRAWRPALVLIGSAAISIPLIFWIFTAKNDSRYLQYGFGVGEGRGRTQTFRLDRMLPDEAAGTQERLLKGEARPKTTVSVEREAEISHDAKLVSGTLESEQANLVITGRMTLLQIEKESGIPAGRILTRMGLPSDIARNETIGRLRRLYGFSIPDLRTAIESLLK